MNSYDAWKTGYYEHEALDLIPVEETDDQKKLERAFYWVESIVERLYNKEEGCDVGMLESDLDELCHILGVKMNTGDIQIQAKQKPVSNQTQEFMNIIKRP